MSVINEYGWSSVGRNSLINQYLFIPKNKRILNLYIIGMYRSEIDKVLCICITNVLYFYLIFFLFLSSFILHTTGTSICKGLW